MLNYQTALSNSLEKLEGAYAENTLRAYRSDFLRFIDWCDNNNLCPLPAKAEDIADYISSQMSDLKAASIRRCVASIGRIHRANRYEDPTRDEDVYLALRRMHRKLGRRQKQALGMTATLRNKLLEACPNDLIGLRDAALLRLAYDSMRRRSELVSMRVEDLHPIDDGSVSILLRFSKTDQEGLGKRIYLTEETHQAVRKWLRAAGIDSGHILRGISRHGSVGPGLNAGSVGRVYKKLAKRAGLGEEIVSGISGHSARVGAAQDLVANGHDVISIMHKGGWSSAEIVARYIERMPDLRLP